MSPEDLQTKGADLPEAVALQAFAPDALLNATSQHGEWTILIEPRSIRISCEFLKTQFSYRTLSNATAVDWYPSAPRFELVYHLLSQERKTRLRLKCKVSGDLPEIDSVTGVWSSASWDEREIFDLFGIRFNGHPDLRRLLLPDGWEGYPLRKDYPVTGYR